MLLLDTPGLVRPRWNDGTLDEPLPLEDLWREEVLAADAPPTLLIVQGPRGSGVSTALRWLAGLEPGPGEVRRRIVLPGELLDGSSHALRERLAAGEAVLVIDRSLGAEDPVERERILGDPAVSELLMGCRVLLGTTPPGSEWASLLAMRSGRVVTLAGWSRDDLIELLGAEPYRAARPWLLRQLPALPTLGPALSRPRAARRLVEAALACGDEAPLTVCGLYAQVLDQLQPGTLEVLRALPPAGVDGLLLLQAWAAAGRPREAAREVAELFQVSAAVARELEHTKPVERDLESLILLAPGAELLLPGLHDFLQAGEMMGRLSRGTPGPVAASWLPYLPELTGPALRVELRGALSPESWRGPEWHAPAATILHACGENLPLHQERSRPLLFHGALLQGLDAPGARLTGVGLAGAVLDHARLDGADLSEAAGTEASLRGVRLGGAKLERARLFRCDLSRASLEGARLSRARLTACRLAGAVLAGADLIGARLIDGTLEGADLRGARLHGATLGAIELGGADLSDADLPGALLRKLDLRRLAGIPTNLGDACLEQSLLDGLCFDGARALGVHLDRSDLGDATFRHAELGAARFENCRAHGAVFDGANLRGAVFVGVDFQAGSSRAGMLLGAPPMEGSKTGYYLEGTTDEAWAAPESIRQASFRGADLRGASFAATQLFRVDFRGARMDPELVQQARQQGAILD